MDPSHSTVCGGKSPKFLDGVDTGFPILSLIREIWLKVSIGQKAAVTEVNRYFLGTPVALQIAAQS